MVGRKQFYKSARRYGILLLSTVFFIVTSTPIHAQPNPTLLSQLPTTAISSPSEAQFPGQPFGGQLAVFLGDESVEFSPDSSRILTFKRFEYLSGYPRLWDTNGNLLAVLQHETNQIKRAIFSPDSQQVLTTDDQNVHLWDRNGNLLAILSHEDYFSIEFSPNSLYILTISKQDVRLWSKKGKLLAVLQHENSEFKVAIFSPDSYRILTTNTWGGMQLWDKEGHLLNVLETEPVSDRGVVFSPDGSLILTNNYSYSNGCNRRLWDRDGNLLTTIQRECRKISINIFSPDGNYLLVSSDNIVSLWDKRGNFIKEFLHHQEDIVNLYFSPDGHYILTENDENEIIHLWDIEGNLLAVIHHQGKIHSIQFSPDGRYILTENDENNSIVLLWSIEGNLSATLQHQGGINSLQFSPDSRYVLTSSNDKTARLWNLDGETIAVLQNKGEWISNPVFSPDGNYILAKSGIVALLWDKQGNPLATIQGHAGINSIDRAIFSPDGHYILTTNEYDDKTSRLWDISAIIAIQVQQRLTLQSLEVEVSDRNAQLIKVQGSIAALSPDGKFILTAGPYHEARLWDVQGNLLTVFSEHEGWISGIAFSPDSSQILTEAHSAIRLWNREGELLVELRHNDLLRDVAFSPDGNYILAVGSLRSTSSLWDRQGNRLVTFPEGNAKFSPDGRFILTFADGANKAHLWDTKGNLLTVFQGHGDSILGVKFSPDGRRILTESSDKTARLWDIEGNILTVFRGHDDSVFDAAFNLDGNRILTASGVTVRLWDAQGNLLKVLQGHEDLIFIAKFSPDGNYILTAGRDNTARLWDREGNPLAIFRGHEIFVTDAEFTPDGRYILTTSIQDDTTRLWDVSAAIAAYAEQSTALQGSQMNLSDENAPQAEAALQLATQLNQQGTVESSQQALQKLDAALNLYLIDNNLAKAAHTLRLIGNIHTDFGQFQVALDAYIQALSLSRQSGDRAEEASILNRLGQLHTDLAVPETALDYHNQALPLLYQLNDKGGAAATFNNIGNIQADTNKWEAALDAYTKALIISRPAGDLAAEATALSNIGSTYIAAEDWGTALHAYQQALLIIRHLNDKISESSILSQIGKIHAALGDNATALEYYNQALLISREVGNRLGEASVLSSLAGFYKDQENSAAAIYYYQQAITMTESIQGEIQLEELKSSFASERIDPYFRLINLLGDQGDFRAVFNYVERAKARAFLDQIANGRIDFRAGVNAQLLQQEKDLNNQIAVTRGQLSDLRSQPQDQWDTGTIAETNVRLIALQQDYANLLIQIKLQSPATASLVTVDVAPLEEIQSLLEPKTTLIEYFVTGGRTFAFVLTRDSFNTVLLDIHREDLVETITLLRDFPDRSGEIPPELQQLHQVLMEPLQPYLKTSRLIIVPHDILHYLPFAALTDGARYLNDDYVISLLPSANTLRYLPEPHDLDQPTLLALGNPDISASLSPLRYAEEEVEAIARLFNTQPLIRQAATESAVRSARGKVSILHLAVHGEYDPINSLFSTLHLATDDDHDGRLEVREIYGLDLTQSTNLVVLSACQTSIGRQSRGDEIVGLNRAFLYAGTPTVLSSLWNVDDAVTAMLMEQFYNHLQTGSDPATALQQAQQAIKQNPDYAHPSFWSAFSVTGRADP